MGIRPGGPDDIAAVLALGDEAVKWMNARKYPAVGYRAVDGKPEARGGHR
jgi:hypothetical protein